jgi:outer membrane protein insertion porin family
LKYIQLIKNYKQQKEILPKIISAIFLISFLCLFSLKSSSQDNYEIRKIKIKGNKTFSKSEILDVINIKETNFVQRKIQKKDPSLYDHEYIKNDILRIIQYYQSEGFLKAHTQIDSVKIINEKKKRVDLYISIKEDIPIKVDSISISFVEPYPKVNIDSLTMRTPRNLRLKHGRRFSDKTLYDDIQRINTRLVNLGYVYTNTQFDLDLKLEKNTTDIFYKINAGPICKYGETTISGNKYIKEKIIRKQLKYIEGKQFNQDRLEDTRKLLYNLQLFRIVSIAPQKDIKTMRNPIPIEIRIEEMPRWMSKFGIGWGTEDKFRAFADITYRGILGGSSRLNLYAKHSALTPYYVSLSWIQPQFLIRKLSLTINPYIKRENEPGYNTQTIGLNVPFGYTINGMAMASISYYLEKVTQHIESDDAEVPNSEDDKFLYNKSGITGVYTYNNSTPVYYAYKGWNIAAGWKINGYIFGMDFNYTRLWFDVRKYQKINGFVISGRLMWGGIYSSDENGFIPVEDRFYSGGSNSNRGWARAGLGPKRESGTPLGGKSIIEMNLEVRHKLFWKIDLAAFVDAGNVWTPAYYYRFNELAYAAGGGLRIDTPIGPVRIDVGVPLRNEKKSIQFFLSIGQAF